MPIVLRHVSILFLALAVYHPSLSHSRPSCSSSLPSFFPPVSPAAGLATALMYRDRYTIAVPRCTAMATVPASCLAMCSSGSIPSCSCPARAMSRSSRTASGAIPPHVSTAKGNNMASCRAAVFMYFCFFTCCSLHAAPAADSDEPLVTYPGALG